MIHWNETLATLPNAHFLQTEQWAQIKAPVGWQPFYLLWQRASGGGVACVPASQAQPERETVAAALVLQRTLPLGGFAARVRLLYAPKGPLLDWSDAPLRRQVLDDLHQLARRQGAIFIKIDPDVRLGTGIPGQPDAVENPTAAEVTADLRRLGWRYSAEQIQFRNTVQIDLTLSEEQLLANMKQKTRYNVRLAERKGVTVRVGGLEDLDLLYHMYAETAVRDDFVIRERSYYHTLWSTFIQAGLAEPLIAEFEGEPISAVVIFRFAGSAWYKDGMSRALHREKMPTYLLQWEGMRRAKAAGCRVYDLWGAPEVFDENDSLWGVYRFKEGLGGTVVRHLGAWDLPLRPTFYRLYTQTLPRLLDVMRRRGKAATRQSIGEA